MARNWILLGMMGSGKSSIGRALADETGRRFIDTDVLIEQRFGRRIPEIFRIYSEAAFRDHETSVLRSLECADSVIATGGGIVLRDENWTELRRLGVTVYLDADVATLAERLGAARRKRPLLDHDDWLERLARLHAERRPHYLQADIHAPVAGKSIEACVQDLMSLLMPPSTR